eukprot:TRINITY_DN18110_c0_g1_i6.p2 TRINITY_DN18110_c0_g1~~TRINITY_DN18110_c0_g1_i6.p2  ORF type:complete len:380 (+),score=37.25 TRINITY_DN18110_c0_g1_i6:102-1142(+)
MGVILFNKWLLAFSGFPFPISLTLWHMTFCSVVGFLSVRVFKVVEHFNMSNEEYVKLVLPIGLLYAASLWLSNSSYLYLSVSFIQMTKSLMPGLVYLCGIFIGTEKFGGKITGTMVWIGFGVLVCAVGEVNLAPLGLACQLSALFFEALRLTLTQVLINSKGYKMNPLQSLYYVSPACLVCLFLPWYLLELPQLQHDTQWHFIPSAFLANGLAAFGLNLAVFLLIGKTSALTMNIAGVVKDWLLILFSYYGFQQPVTFLNLLGYVFCCSGVAVYQYFKLQQMKEQEKMENETPLIASKNNNVQSTNGNKEKKDDDKEKILEEMRRLQAQMDYLEERLESKNREDDA